MAEEQTVKQWLKSLSLEQYETNFMENGFETMELVCNIDSDQQLIGIGIDKMGHRIAIMKSIKILSSPRTQCMFCILFILCSNRKYKYKNKKPIFI